jgi:hypothetical protein
MKQRQHKTILQIIKLVAKANNGATPPGSIPECALIYHMPKRPKTV